MTKFYNSIFFAQAGPSSPGSPSIFNMFIPMVLMFVIMYFILIKPQQKKQKDHLAMIKKVKAGDKIVTNGGIHGTIAAVKEHTVFLKITDNVKIEINRSSIGELGTTDKASTEPVNSVSTKKRGMLGANK